MREQPLKPVPSAARKEITRHIVVAVTVLALAFLVRTIAEALVIAFGGIVLAAVLLSLSLPLARATKLAPRWSLLIVIAGLVALTGLFCWLFGNEVAKEVTEIQQRLPGAVEKFTGWLNSLPAGRVVLESLKSSGINEQALTRLSGVLGAVFGATGNLLLIVFLAIYFAADPTLYRDGAVRLVPVARRAQVKRTLDHAGVALRKWVVAQAIAMIAVGLLTGIALALLRVPLAVSLGILAGLLEFIPVIGPILSAVPGVLLAFSSGPQMAVYTAFAYVAVQQIESNILTPLVQRWAVKLPPVVGLLAIVACGLVFGVLGVIFAMPMAVVTMVFVKDLYVKDTLERREGGEAISPRESLPA